MNESNANYPLPDPAWDYYMLWESLHRAKAKIDQALIHAKECESSSHDSDQMLEALVRDAIAILRHQSLPCIFTPDEPT